MMLRGLKMHKLEALQWQRTVIVPLLFMRSYGGTKEPPPPFNTLDDCASEGLVAGEDEVSPALPHPTQSSTTSLPHNYTGLCYEVTLGERESGWGEARSPSPQA